MLGGLLSSLTLLLALSTHWSLKDLQYHHQAQVEGERLRRLGQAESYLKVQLLGFIITNGGSIGEWRRGKYVDRERASRAREALGRAEEGRRLREEQAGF